MGSVSLFHWLVLLVLVGGAAGAVALIVILANRRK